MKKKWKHPVHRCAKSLTKILLVMRISLLLLFVGVFELLAVQVQAQNEKVSIVVKNKTVREVLEKIEQESNYKFFYNEGLIDVERKVSIQENNTKITDLLKDLFSGTGVTHKLIDGNIILTNILAGKEVEQLTVKGKVTDASGESLPGVAVMIKGTSDGTITDMDGNYTISKVPANATLQFSFIGMKTLEINVDGKSSFNIVMEDETVGVDEVVVTALGISQQKKALGYSVQEVKSEDMSGSRDANMINKLSGKVAGLNITSASSIGGSSRIVLRGESSLSRKGSSPLIVVDGVPIDNTDQSGSGYDWGSGIGDISMDDVASVNVLKGPVAAALYGSRAGNGAIVIVSKSGKNASKATVEVNSSYMFESLLKYPDTYQHKYGPGKYGNSLLYNEDGTYNPYLYDEAWANVPYDENKMVAAWWSPTTNGNIAADRDVIDAGNIIKTPYVSNGKNNYKEFYETGIVTNNNISAIIPGKNSHLRMSYTNFKQEGVQPGTKLKRHNFSVVGGGKIAEKLTLDVNVNVLNSDSPNRPKQNYGKDGIGYLLGWMPAGTRMDVLKNYWQPGLEGEKQRVWRYNHNNPYFVSHEMRNAASKNRGFGNVSANWQITSKLSLMARYGIDYTDEKHEIIRPFGAVGGIQPSYELDKITRNETNADFLVTYKTDLTKKLHLGLNFGGNTMHNKLENIWGRADKLLVPNIYNLNNSAVPLRNRQNLYEKEINSLYGMANLSFNNAVYLNLTARNDWSSTLPSANNSYFYPSAGLSFLMNEIMPMPDFVSFSKLRLAVAQVGKDTDPYRLEDSMVRSTDYGGQLMYGTSANIANRDLKPEMTTSYEMGINVELFKYRMSVDFTYYHISTENQVIPVSLPIESGYNSRTLNAGKIQNKGVELMISGFPVKNSKFSWEVSAGFAKNNNKLVELGEGLTQYSLGGFADGGQSIIAEVGGPVFGVFGYKQLTVDNPNSDSYGRKVYDANGLPVRKNTQEYIGNANPDWTLGLTNAFKYHDLELSFLFDIRQGGLTYSGITNIMNRGGYNQESVRLRDEGIIGDGVVEQADGTYVENTRLVKGDEIKGSWSGRYRQITENNIYDASYVKLRDVSLSYNLPKSLLKRVRISNAKLSLIGRNLMLWSDVPNSDPDIYMDGVPGNTGTFYIPSTKTYGVSLNVKF